MTTPLLAERDTRPSALRRCAEAEGDDSTLLIFGRPPDQDGLVIERPPSRQLDGSAQEGSKP